jgi:CDP-glucose 4,6-dehydratase
LAKRLATVEGLAMIPVARTFAGQRVLVTGHTGFKGAWLSLWLARLGAKVFGLALEPATEPNLFDAARVCDDIDHAIIDLRDYEAIAARIATIQPTMIFHLAAQALVRESYQRPLETFETNVLGVVNLLEAVRCSGTHCAVLIVTTDKVYENREWLHGYRETDRLGGNDPYSASKAAAEIAAASYRRSFFADGRVAVATARAGNVIGGGDWAHDRLMPDLLSAFAAGKRARIRNPSAVRPWQHVLDPLAGYMALMTRLVDRETISSDAFNFGPDNSGWRTVAGIAELAALAWGADASVEIASEANAPHEAGRLMLANDKAAALLGWRPVWNVEKAVLATVDWHRSFTAGGDVRALCVSQIDNFSRERLVS